jgi:hypothetical protein
VLVHVAVTFWVRVGFCVGTRIFPATDEVDLYIPRNQLQWNLMLNSQMNYLGHNNNLVSREVKLLDSLSQDDFGKAVRVIVGGVERLNSSIVCCFNMLQCFFLR